MKRKNKALFGFVLSAGLVLGGFVTINAAGTWTSAKVTGIPGGGHSSTDYNHFNVKVTTRQIASFGPSKNSAWFGNDGCIVNQSGTQKSNWAGLVSDMTNHADEINASLDYYYLRARSTWYEGGNNNTVSLRFSADNQ